MDSAGNGLDTWLIYNTVSTTKAMMIMNEKYKQEFASLQLPVFLTYYTRFILRNWEISWFAIASRQLELELGTQ